MDKLKSAVGLGGKGEEGQEPVSGGKGEGTATEPFDAGNSQEATQTADKTEGANAIAPGQTDGLATQQQSGTTTAPASEPVAEPPRSPSNSAGKQPDRGSSIGSGSGVGLTDRSRSTGGPGGTGGAQLQGSRGEHRGSMIPADAPRYKRVENPNAIPTAGGKRIGEEQYTTRRASMAPPASPPRDMKSLDREGSPDPVTAENTETNTAPVTVGGPAAGDLPPSKVPEAKNTAPQQMKEFSMGDASKEAEAKPVGPGPIEDVPPEEGPGGTTASSFTPTPSNEGKKENESGGGGHGRRGSVFGKLKDKMKGKKSP